MLRHRLPVTVLLVVLATTTAWSQQASDGTTSNQRPSGKTAAELSQPSKRQILASYGQLPLSFEVNQGQTDKQVKFVSRRPGFSLFLTPTEAVLALSKPLEEENPEILPGARPVTPRKLLTSALHIRLVGANVAPSVNGLEELAAKSNYFIGNDAKKWQTNIPNYARLKYASVYPGVDLVYYGNQGRLEHDFIVARGADPRAITLGFDRRERLSIDDHGDLVVKGRIGEVRLEKPVVYQEVGGVRQPVASAYIWKGRNQIGFRLGQYDGSKTLVIDPVLSYSTYTSPGLPSGYATVTGIAVDSAGSAYVVGTTNSANFPTSAGAFQTTLAASCCTFFVMKLNAAGSAVVYSTYLGGGNFNNGFPGPGIAVDSAGSAYVTASTTSSSFPTTSGAFQTSIRGPANVFVTKLNATGSGLVYSTYLGGSSFDDGIGIAVDSSGSAYVTGQSSSSNDFPVTPGAYQTNSNASVPCFVTKLNAFGTALDYSTYLGSQNYRAGLAVCNAIAVDSAGSAYVTGYTESAHFPTTPGSFQASQGPSAYSTFVTKLSADGSSLAYSTYLTGNSNGDVGDGIAVDSAGSAYVTGLIGAPNTSFPASPSFPATPGALQTTFSGSGSAVFVTKLTADGSGVIYSTYLGNTGLAGVFDLPGPSIAVDSAGSAYVTGGIDQGRATSLPTTADAFQASNPGQTSSAFVTKLTADGSGLIYSTYLGGNGQAWGSGIAVDSAGSIYLAGPTGSNNFPTTAGAAYPVYNSTTTSVGFVAKFAFDQPSVLLSPTSLNFPSTTVGQSSTPQTVTFAAGGTGALAFSKIALAGTNAGDYALSGNTCGPTLGANASCQAQVAFAPTGAGTRSATLQFTDDVSGSPQSVPLGGTGLSQAPTTTTLTSSLNSAQFGQSVTFTATLSSSAEGTPTGTVAFYDGATSLGSSVLSGTLATFSISSLSVGTHSITAVYGGDTNFTSSTSTANTLTITAATLTVVAKAQTKTYGQPDPALSYTATGFQFSDTAASVLTGGLTRAAGENVGSYAITQATLVANANYTISFTGNTLTITPASVTASITANNKSYDATVVATITACKLTGVLAADISGVSCATGSATFADANVGSSKTVTATGITLSGAAAGNYQLSAASATTTANITPASVTASVTANDKVYDGTTVATIASQSVAGVLSSDAANVSVSGGSATFSDANVGTGKTVTVSGLSLTGGAASNYQLSPTTATTTANITPKSVTASITTNNKIYDGTTAATIASQSVAGVLSSDTANVSLSGGTATFSDANVGMGKTVTVSGLSLTGSAAGNYQLSAASATTTANITQAPLIVAASNATRPYGAANPTFGGTITGVKTGDSITATYTSVAGPTSPVGTYAITPVLSDPGGRLGNYTVTSTNGTLTVTQAATTTVVSVTPVTVQYSDYTSFSAQVAAVGGQTPTGTIQFSLNGSAVGAPAALSSSGAATLSQIQVTLPAGSYPVSAVFSSTNANFAGNSGIANQPVTQENAFILYTGDTIAQVGTPLNLRATVWDSAAAGYPGINPETGPSATIGDITRMWIAFDIYPAGSCGSGTPSTLYAQVATTTTAGVGTATIALSSSSEVSYCAIPRLVAGITGGTNLYYVASNAQPAGVDFYQSSGQFATGGGWVIDPTGSHGNFSFNARYNSSGSPKGQKVYTYRALYNGVLADFIFKSNALTGLQFSGTTYPISATLQGKANVQISRATDGYVLFSAGNYTFSATITDSGQNGQSGKQFSLIVYDPSGVPFHSVPVGTPLQGGDVVVHSK